jgi:hypothetical protein
MNTGSHTRYRQERESKSLLVRRNLVLRLRIPRPELRPRFERLVSFGHFAWGMGLLNIMSEGGAKM